MTRLAAHGHGGKAWDAVWSQVSIFSGGRTSLGCRLLRYAQRYRQAQRMPGEGEREAQAWHGGAMQMHDLWHYQGRLDREAA